LSRALVLALLVLAGAARADDCLDLGLYGSVLQANTKSVPELEGTRVDYAALRLSPQWADVVKSLAMCDPAKQRREQQLAFWINAYNVLAMTWSRSTGRSRASRTSGPSCSPSGARPPARSTA
jgi:hypothetical protein